VADAFDAMTTNRAYRLPRSPEQAIQELRRCAGVQFDDAVIEAFLQAYGDGSAVHR
jgi:HD-GYP domain-containing protein (c-di-GMP phosphodiesterase class II)